MSGRVKLGKRKLNTAISTIQEKVARALNVTPEEINLDTSTTEDVDLLRIKAENFDKLMQLIKEKFSKIKTDREIILVLTLAPETWSIKKVSNFFVKEYAARKARSLVQEKGILTLPDKKRKKTYLKIQVIWLKHSMKTMNFLDKCLEKKIMLVFPTIPTKTILSNLNKLYANFKSKYVSISIGF